MTFTWLDEVNSLIVDEKEVSYIMTGLLVSSIRWSWIVTLFRGECNSNYRYRSIS